MVWLFVRGSEQLTCEARRCETGYEVALRRPDGLELVYHFGTSSELIESMHRVPRTLLNEGWQPRTERRAAEPPPVTACVTAA